MSEKRPLFIPHPLCREDAKVRLDTWGKQGVDSLSQYLKDSLNPRWAASHLVRVIGASLVKADPKASMALRELANELASRGDGPCNMQGQDVAQSNETEGSS